MTMFMKAAEHVAHVSGEKTLHPVTDLNTAERFKPLCIVERRNSFWFWRKPSMTPTLVKMKDLLLEDLDLSAKKKNFTLLKDFQEHPNLEVSAAITAKILSEANIELKADEKLNLVLKLGDIEKNEVSWEQLSDALKTNRVNREHPLYLRAKQHPYTSLCVVIGSISTKDDGSLEKHTATSISTDDTLKVSTVISAEIHAKGSLEKKSAYSFTIPPGTVLAYSCVEFSISPCGDLITLHCTFDTLDDKDAPPILATANLATSNLTGNLDSKDGRPNDDADANGERYPIDIVKGEVAPLIQYEKFEGLKRELNLLVCSASTTNNMFSTMQEFLRHADNYLESKNADNFILLAPFRDLLEDDKDLPGKAVLDLLGFSLPKDASNENAFVVLPGSHDNASTIKACMGMVDAIMELSYKARELLQHIPSDHVKLILSIIEMQLQNHKVIDLPANFGQPVNEEDSPTLMFLKECGLLISGNDQIVDFAGDEKSSLLDVYVVLYVLYTENK